MSLAELKEAVVALSAEERHQLRDVLDALEEGVTVEQLHEIDHMLDEAINSTEPRLSLHEARLEIKKRLGRTSRHAA
jgi:hypothetical protein